MRFAPLLLLVLTTGGSFLHGTSGTKTEDNAPDSRALILQLRRYVEDLAARHAKFSRAEDIDLDAMTGRDLLALELFDRGKISSLFGNGDKPKELDPAFEVIVNMPNDCNVKMKRTQTVTRSTQLWKVTMPFEWDLRQVCKSTSLYSRQHVEYSISRGSEVVISDGGMKTMKEFKDLQPGNIFYVFPIAKSIGKAMKWAKDVEAGRLKRKAKEDAKDAKKAAKAQRS